jgi:hypothetical protein
MPQFDVYYTVCERHHAVVEAPTREAAEAHIHKDGIWDGNGDDDFYIFEEDTEVFEITNPDLMVPSELAVQVEASPDLEEVEVVGLWDGDTSDDWEWPLER